MSGLSSVEVRGIYLAEGKTSDIASAFGVPATSVNRIKLRSVYARWTDDLGPAPRQTKRRGRSRHLYEAESDMGLVGVRLEALRRVAREMGVTPGRVAVASLGEGEVFTELSRLTREVHEAQK